MPTDNSLEKSLMLEKIESRRKMDGWMASLVQWTWTWSNSRRDREGWYAAVHGVAKSQTWLGNWTAITYDLYPNGGLVAQLCPTLCNPVDYSLPGSSVHGVSLARILELVVIFFSGDLPKPGLEPGSPALRQILYQLSHQGSPCILLELLKIYIKK